MTSLLFLVRIASNLPTASCLAPTTASAVGCIFGVDTSERHTSNDACPRGTPGLPVARLEPVGAARRVSPAASKRRERYQYRSLDDPRTPGKLDFAAVGAQQDGRLQQFWQTAPIRSLGMP